MFSVIEKKKREKNFFKRLLPAHSSLERVDLGNAEYFLRVSVSASRGRVRWDEVRALLGKGVGRVLCADGLVLPENSGLKPLNPRAFSRALTVNSAVKFIEATAVNSRECSLTYYDPSAAGRDLLKKFYDLCSVIKVVTDRPNYYEAEVFRAMQDKGLAIMVSTDLSSAFDSVFAVCPEPPDKPVSFCANTAVIASCEKNLFTSKLFLAQTMRIPPSVRSIMPQGVSSKDFLGALYEYAGCDYLGDSVSPTLKYRNLYLNYFEAADKFTIDR